MKNPFKVKTISHKLSSLQSAAGQARKRYDIIYNGICVGNIDHKSFQIGLRVIKEDINSDGNPNCKWRWAHLKPVFLNMPEARDWLNQNSDLIFKSFTLVTE